MDDDTAVNFSTAEFNFVKAGGNLWYVTRLQGDGWEIVRWSLRHGRRVFMVAFPTQEDAEKELLRYVRPSSSRASTAIHHEITRPNEYMKAAFPILFESPAPSAPTSAP